MSKQKSILNQASSEVISDNHLLENPEGLPDESTGIVLSTHIPKMVRAIFENARDPGVALIFHYHSKTHPLKHYTLYDGLEHILAEEVIEHLEECGETTYGYRKNREGHPEQYATGKKYIFRFRKKRAA